jgi:hypothetical protein
MPALAMPTPLPRDDALDGANPVAAMPVQAGIVQ